jgi:hypothetical protein
MKKIVRSIRLNRLFSTLSHSSVAEPYDTRGKRKRRGTPKSDMTLRDPKRRKTVQDVSDELWGEDASQAMDEALSAAV